MFIALLVSGTSSIFLEIINLSSETYKGSVFFLWIGEKAVVEELAI